VPATLLRTTFLDDPAYPRKDFAPFANVASRCDARLRFLAGDHPRRQTGSHMSNLISGPLIARVFDRKPRLLIIDDDPLVLRAYARILQHEFTVECESEAPSALRRIANGDCFDVILCDLHLGPSVSGQDFFELLPPDLQVRTIVCTGAAPDEDDAFAKALGDHFFMKPGRVGALGAILHRVAHAGRLPPRVAA
jgi:CheY-like chemotaxis protein